MMPVIGGSSSPRRYMTARPTADSLGTTMGTPPKKSPRDEISNGGGWEVQFVPNKAVVNENHNPGCRCAHPGYACSSSASHCWRNHFVADVNCPLTTT